MSGIRCHNTLAITVGAHQEGGDRVVGVDGLFQKRKSQNQNQNQAAGAGASGSRLTDEDQQPSTSNVVVPVRVTEKMRAREEYSRGVANEGGEEEEGELEMFDGEGEEVGGSGKEEEDIEREVLASVPTSSTTARMTTTKRKRPLPMDPFICKSI